MPKQVVSKDEILEAALKMTREQGYENVNARSIAKFTGHSVQPIYSYFLNMDDLKDALYLKGIELYNQFIYSRADGNFILQSMAMANIAFAKCETNLFRLLFLTELKGISGFSDIFDKMGDKEANKVIAQSMGISEQSARHVYIMLIIFTHGIATMLATSGANISDEEIYKFVENAYDAFILKEKHNDRE